MFHSARLRLTAWYIAIILLISLLFSTVIFVVINREYSRIERLQQERASRFQQRFITPYQSFFEENGAGPQMLMIISETEISEARMRLLLALGLVNVTIVIGAGFAGYLLAGRTLQPIQDMVDEQNRFITDASHELRTPLTSLKTTIEVYLRSKHHTVKEADAMLTSSLDDVNNLQRLSDNLIKLNQGQQRSAPLPLEPIALQDLITEAVQKTQVQAKHKKIALETDVTDVTITGNKHNLLEVLVILLDNAIKYSNPKTTVRLTANQIDHNVRISIQDYGIGIAPDALPHIFDRFYRADAARSKQDNNGYGLGLAIAKQTIEQHHGTIAVESRPENGTTFIILLPLKQPS